MRIVLPLIMIRQRVALVAALVLVPLPLTSACAAPEAATQADDSEEADTQHPLVKAALAKYPIEDIPSPDRDGRYQLPKPGDSDVAREARSLLTKAAATGNAEAHRMLGDMAEAGVGGAQDFAAARRHYAAAGQDRMAQWRLGLLVLSGKGGNADPQAARALFRRSSEDGQIDASYEYGRMLELGLGGPKDPAAAREIYAATLAYCHGGIADRYSIMLVRGIGGPVDRPRAAAMQIKAFECHNRHFAMPAAISQPELFDRQTIVEMQQQLREQDYDGPIDGQFNAKMMAVLRGLI